MSNNMKLIMEGWRGYLLEEQASRELHHELLTEDLADILQKLKGVPSTIKNIKDKFLKAAAEAWEEAALKVASKAYNVKGSIDDFVKEHMPENAQKFAVPLLIGLIVAGIGFGCGSCRKAAEVMRTSGGSADISLISEFLLIDLPKILHKLNLSENTQRL